MREETAALAKLTRPRLVATVARERLFRLLDERLAYPAVWVTGPPGSGKTTLLAGYAEIRKRPTLWYHLDSGDADVATFFFYLGIAGQHLTRRKHTQALPVLTPEYLPDLPAFTRRFFRELYARLPRRALLVLDDYHEVPPGSPLHGVIACALAELPECVGAIVASRTEAPPEWARLAANQSIVELEREALRLTESETAAIARTRQVTDESSIRALHLRSDGWVAGLILLLRHPAVNLAAADILTPTSKSLFNYFAGIFKDTLSAEMRHVLLSTTFLGSITGRLAVHLSSNEHAERLLNQLHENSYFVHRREGSETTYQLHALFREFLLAYVDQRCDPGERLAQQQQTADALALFGKDEEAAILYSEADDWARASTLILSIAPGLLLQGRYQTLQALIAACPANEVAVRPWLQYWQGVSQMAADPIAARTTLTRAYEGFAREQDGMGQILAAATVIEILFVLWSDFTSLERWIEAIEQSLASGVVFPDEATEIRVLSSLVQALTFGAPWRPKLHAHAHRLLELAESDATPSLRILAAAALSHHFSWLGNTERSLQACSIARSLLEQKEILPVHKVWACMCLAYASYTRADHGEGDVLFGRAFELTKEHGLAHAEFWMRAADCWRRLDRGEYKAVAVTLAKLESGLAAGRGMDVKHFYFVRGWLALLEEELVSARRDVETGLAISSRVGSNYTESYDLLVMANILIESMEYAQAGILVGRFRAIFGPIDSPVFEFNALLVDAYAALHQRDDAKCVIAMRAAFLIGRTQGYVTTLNWCSRMMARLCEFALEQEIERDYARMLIVRRHLTTDTALESWPWPVKIYTLGRFGVLAHGEALHFEGKAQHRPIELAKTLVALGGRDVPADKLIDILWPEPSEGDGQKAFDITVHRLRKLLGSDHAVEVVDRRATLNPRLVWVDVWALERTLAPLIGAVNAAEPDIALLEAAAPRVLNMYRGHFLAGDIEKAWQVPIRNRLAGRFQRFVVRLGEHWESRQQWRRAADLYQRGIDLEPLAESFYRRQMICLQAQGQRAEAIDVFRRCRHALSVTLGVAPAAETDAIYRQLLAS